MAKCSKCPQTFLTEWPRFCSRRDCPQRGAAEREGMTGYIDTDDMRDPRMHPAPGDRLSNGNSRRTVTHVFEKCPRTKKGAYVRFIKTTHEPGHRYKEVGVYMKRWREWARDAVVEECATDLQKTTAET